MSQLPNEWRQFRESLGVKSQRKMAVILGVSNMSVNDWETDRRPPTLPIKFLAEKYQTSEKRIERALIDQRKRIELRESKRQTVSRV